MSTIKVTNIQNPSSGTDDIQIDANGNVAVDTNTLYVDATNNRVGIGTTSVSGGQLVINSTLDASNKQLVLRDATNGWTRKIGVDSSNKMAFYDGDTERVAIDGSGRLLVGTSSSVALDGIHSAVNIKGSAANPGINFLRNQNAASVPNGGGIGLIGFGSQDGGTGAFIQAFADGTWSSTTDCPGGLAFYTTADSAGSPSERLRITSAGKAFVNYASSSAIESEVFGVQGTSALVGRFTNNTNTSGYHGIRTSIGSNGNNTNTYHFSGNTSGVNNWYLFGNGTTSYSSDERLKKNIETTRDGYLDDIKQLRVVKYNWKNHEDGTPKELGLIAQEVAQVFPGLVQDDLSAVADDDATIYKQLKGSVLPIILLKALQEAAEKIETLEARLSALEAS